MNKVKVKGPILELDGDGLARELSQEIKDKIINTYLDIDIKYFDLNIHNRDASLDKVTTEAYEVFEKYQVILKCPTLELTQETFIEFGCKEMWKSTQEILNISDIKEINIFSMLTLWLEAISKRAIIDTDDKLILFCKNLSEAIAIAKARDFATLDEIISLYKM